MTVLKILSGTIVGTSLMTAFSYLFSNTFNKQFREPVLLNELFNRSKLFDKTSSKLFGWLAHYSIGLIFLVLFHFIWNFTTMDATYLSGLILGFLSGFAGVAGWHLAFTLHNNPPSITLSTHYLHLLAAHIIFGLGAVAGYRII